MTLTTLANDQGFTLTEAVMSLLVLSMGLAGLLQVTSFNAKAQMMIGNHQKDLKLRDQQSAALEKTLADVRPVEGQFTGNPELIRAKDQSDMEHDYHAPPGWKLSYLSNGEVFKTWPPAASEAETDSRSAPLSAVALSNNKDQPVKVVRIWLEQGVDCQFDMITRECRELTP